MPDATFEVFGDGSDAFSSGVYKSNNFGGQHGAGYLQRHPHRPVDNDRRAETLAGAVRQLSGLRGTVIAGPSPETVMGVTGTHLRLSLPVNLECPGGHPRPQPTSWRSGTV